MASFHHAVANWLGSAWVGASGGNRPGCSSPSFLSVPVRLGTVAATQRIASANFAATVASLAWRFRRVGSHDVAGKTPGRRVRCTHRKCWLLELRLPGC